MQCECVYRCRDDHNRNTTRVVTCHDCGEPVIDKCHYVREGIATYI
jgi:predicted RNA-binding Zn-ribbon protein involved in translation (DUF1610 family)